MNYVYLFSEVCSLKCVGRSLNPSLVLSVINVVVLLTAPHGYSTLLTAFVPLSSSLHRTYLTLRLQRVMHSILSARILLHLRGANRKGNTEIAMLKPNHLFPTMHHDTTNPSGHPEGTNTDFVFGEITDQAGLSTFTRTENETLARETVLEEWFGETRRRSFNGTDEIQLEPQDIETSQPPLHR